MKVRVDHLEKIGLQITLRLSRFHEPVGSGFRTLGEPCSSSARFDEFHMSEAADPPGNSEAVSDLFASTGDVDLIIDFRIFLSPLIDSDTADVLRNSSCRSFDGEGYRLMTGMPCMM